jgi:RimJ/RimL family protein N-acetyltransferase
VNPFEGELVRLAAIRREDLPIYTRWFQDYEVQRMVGVDVIVPQSFEREQSWYDSTIRGDSGFTFGIRTVADDQLIGNCSLFNISPKNHEATFGIVIGEQDFWGRGYGTEATKLTVRFGFTEVNLNRIQLDVYAFNPRAVRAYEKAGFSHEGTRRKALFREGSYHDVHIMAILRDVWLSQNS